MGVPEAGSGLRLAVLAAAAVLLLAGLGNTGVWAPDEPRYIAIAEEMRASERGASDWVLMRLNGEAYTQKPPLYYWLAAGLGAPFGRVSEIAARLPSALAGIALVALTLTLGSRLFGGRVGVLGAGLLLTFYEFARNARRMQLDVLLALCETAALVCFWRIDRGMGSRRPQLAALHAFMGLAVLTKGPVGFLVPVIVMGTYLAWERRLRELPRLLPLWGLLISLGPSLAWLAGATALAPSGFAGEALGPNLIGRFFTGTSHVRPFWYFLKAYPGDCMPWTLLWPLLFWVGRDVFRGRAGAGAIEDERRRAWRFLLAWIGASLVFFSISSGKRGIYLLPTYPALALLTADALVRSLAGRSRMPTAISATAGVLAGAVALLGVDLALAAWTGGSPILANDAFASQKERMLAWLAAVETPLILAFGSALVGVTSLATVAWVVLRRHRAAPLLRVAVIVCTVGAIELAAFLLLFPAADPLRSPRPLATAAAKVTPEDRPIGLFADRAMAGGLAYYADRRVAQLYSADDVRDFLAAGGEAIVVKTRKLGPITEVTEVDVLTRARTGRREVLVVRPADGVDHGAARRRTAP